MSIDKITSAPTPNGQIDKINEIIDSLGSSGNATDVQINGTSITNNNVANILTNTAYNDSSNKIATMSDIDNVYRERNIGEIIPSTIPLTDAGLHLLDGSLISGSGSYADFVSYIASIYDASANYFCSESDWQTSVTNYGVCGKFVYDSTNNTVRLPKINGFTEGTDSNSTLGDLTEAGLPNVTGSFGRVASANNVVSGAFSSSGTEKHGGSGSSLTYYGYSFDASVSNNIYGNSETVQPQSIKVLYYIVVANSTKTDIEIDIDNIATDLNNKADKDFVNINQTAKNTVINTIMPDYANGISYTYTTAHTDQTYTMPNDGTLHYTLSSYNSNNYPAYIKVNGYTVDYMGSSGSSTAQVAMGNINVNKNDIITVNSYYTNDHLTKITFFPMKGAA